VVLALLQLWYLHKSLVLEDPTLVCPLAFCFYNLSSILNGLMYFDQFDQLSSKQLFLVCLGICILLVGVICVSIQEEDEADAGMMGMQIQDGDWTATDNTQTGPVPSSPLIEFGSPFDEQIRVPPGRRTVSSPSALDFSPPPPPSSSDTNVGFESIPFTPRKRTSSEVTPSTPTPSHQHERRHSGVISPRRLRMRRGTMLSSEGGPGEPGASGSGGEGGSGTLPPLGGFSIGLSPISPGFTLVPRHRESRGGEITLSDVPEESGSPGEEGTVVRRRWTDLKKAVVGRWKSRRSGKGRGGDVDGGSGEP